MSLDRNFLVLIVLAVPLLFAPDSEARGAAKIGGDVPVSGYVNRYGTYVLPHYRSQPDGTFSNNWTTYGNINPYTLESGTRTVPSPSSGGRGVPGALYAPSTPMPSVSSPNFPVQPYIPSGPIVLPPVTLPEVNLPAVQLPPTTINGVTYPGMYIPPRTIPGMYIPGQLIQPR